MDVYKKNIQALGKTHPYLVQLIEDTVVDEDRIRISRSGKDEIEVSIEGTMVKLLLLMME